MEPLEKALQILSYKSHSVQELTTKLHRYEYTELQIETAINRLLELRYLNDEEYARNLVQKYGGRGNRYIQSKLYEKGLKDPAYLTFLEELPSETERAEELAQSKGARFAEKKQPIEKLARFLAYRGFSPPVCWKVAKSFFKH